MRSGAWWGLWSGVAVGSSLRVERRGELRLLPCDVCSSRLSEELKRGISSGDSRRWICVRSESSGVNSSEGFSVLCDRFSGETGVERARLGEGEPDGVCGAGAALLFWFAAVEPEDGGGLFVPEAIWINGEMMTIPIINEATNRKTQNPNALRKPHPPPECE